MAAEQSSPFLSFKEVKSNGEAAYVTDTAHRLYWPLAGDFPATISVMKSRRGGLDEREPFCQPDGTWHDIASLPLTEPKVSSIEASIRDLDQWESDWVAWHENHETAEFVTYGDLDDEDRPYASEQNEDGSWEDDSDTEFLIRCCGQDRPLRTRGQKLQVTPSAGKDFVSIHDYVCAVHPWLMGLREDIIQAKIVTRPRPVVVPALASTTEWMVSAIVAPEHVVMTKDEWLEFHRPPRPMSAAIRNMLQRAGARIDPQ
ncbi:hypothetical protein RJ55_01197 [Drechmeria coniospora]|nr:hypothetical protein RJ55_01197 [Drechmeria coniospora]